MHHGYFLISPLSYIFIIPFIHNLRRQKTANSVDLRRSGAQLLSLGSALASSRLPEEPANVKLLVVLVVLALELVEEERQR